MTVEEAINNFPSGSILHFGAISGYVWIAPKEEALRGLKEKSDEYLARYKKFRENDIAKLEFSKKAYNKNIKRAEKVQKVVEEGNFNADVESIVYGNRKVNNPLVNYDNRLAAINYNLNMIEHLPKRIAMYEDIINNFKPFNEREVLDTYPLLYTPNGYSIIFEGTENGKYWFYSEVGKPIKGYDC